MLARDDKRTAAERIRRYRERLKKGQRIAPTPLDDRMVGLLVDYWHKADIPSALHMSALGGKADMPCSTANVCL